MHTYIMMEGLSEEWKSLWPISSVFSAPLLLNPNPNPNPLSFSPIPQTLTPLLSTLSPPHLPPPFPHLSLSSFLSSSSSSLLPSTSSSISSSFGPLLSRSSPSLRRNLLLLLRVPAAGTLLAFFPAGENYDRVGFVVLSIENSSLVAEGDRVRVSESKHNLNHRIVKLLINPVSPGNNSFDYTKCVKKSNYEIIGYVMAYTMYGAQWYSVGMRGNEYVLDFVASKLFKACAIADACWSPHLPEESLVLLENGELFLFDLDDCFENRVLGSRLSGKRLKVSWGGDSFSLGWLGCEFSWHPRILIVAHSSAVFLLDFRDGECDASCLVKVDSYMSTCLRNDRFIAFSKAGSDGFRFVLASEYRLLLCDVRRPLMPLLQWAHDVASPSYVNVFPLSELMSRPKDDDDTYKRAYEFGNCIVMGSFWNCEFNLFCYGPLCNGSTPSDISKLCNTYYAWGLPSDLSITGRECCCGSCLLRDEFWKDSLPEWIDWRQKKEIALGFGILDKDLDIEMSKRDGFGGFTLIRLMSSGKIEAQRYLASCEVVKKPHVEFSLEKSNHRVDDSLLYAGGENEYRFRKRFHYQKFDFLYAYMNDNLDKILSEKLKGNKIRSKSDYLYGTEFHEFVCVKLKACGFRKSDFTISNVLTQIRVLSSVHEISLSKVWADLSVDLLQWAFSYYSQILEVLFDHKKVSLEFLDIPSQPQFPPFLFREPSVRSSKWSQKVRPSTAFVGPVLPTPALLTIHELRKDENFVYSVNTHFKNQCNEVIEAANVITASGSGSDLCDENAVSLADDRDEIDDYTKNVDLITLHKYVPKSYESPSEDAMMEDSFCRDDKFTTFISKTPEKEFVLDIRTSVVGPEMFDSLSPIELKFDDETKFGENVKAYRLLKRHYSNFLRSYEMYREPYGS